jgi:hypothetical protein
VSISIFCILTLFGGLRSSSVGTDTGTYVNQWLNHSFSEEGISITSEIGFQCLQWISSKLSTNYSVYLLTVSAMTVGLLIYGILKNSTCIELSYFLLIASGVYTYHFNAARQGIAIAVCFAAISSLYKKCFWRYCCYVFFASMFHTSALIMIPMYFLVTLPFSWKNNILILIFFIIFVLFNNVLFNIAFLLKDKYVGYDNAGENSTGLISTLFITSLLVFFVYFRLYIKKINIYEYDILLNLFFIGVLIAIFATTSGYWASGIRRCSEYFTVSCLLLWPIIDNSIKEKLNKFIFLTCFISFYFLYFTLTTWHFGNLVPYTFNPTLIQWLY